MEETNVEPATSFAEARERAKQRLGGEEPTEQERLDTARAAFVEDRMDLDEYERTVVRILQA